MSQSFMIPQLSSSKSRRSDISVPRSSKVAFTSSSQVAGRGGSRERRRKATSTSSIRSRRNHRRLSLCLKFSLIDLISCILLLMQNTMLNVARTNEMRGQIHLYIVSHHLSPMNFIDVKIQIKHEFSIYICCYLVRDLIGHVVMLLWEKRSQGVQAVRSDPILLVRPSRRGGPGGSPRAPSSLAKMVKHTHKYTLKNIFNQCALAFF